MFGIHRGRPIVIEAKGPRAKWTDEQKKFKDRWEMAGGIYILAKREEDILEALGVKGVRFDYK